MPLLHIVVTCSNRKKVLPAEDTMFRSIKATQRKQVFHAWRKALDAAGQTALPATSLYAGDHWCVASALPSLLSAKDLESRLWICSAGYGLIEENHLLKPYSATFALHQEDSVGGSVEENQQWWDALSRWQGPTDGYPSSTPSPRSIKSLVNQHPEDIFLLVLSEPYLRALEKDIQSALEQVKEKEQFIILSSGGRQSIFSEYILSTSSLMQAEVSGTLGTLNVRIARWLFLRLQQGELFSFSWAQQQLSHISSIPTKKKPIVKITDEEVLKKIETIVSKHMLENSLAKKIQSHDAKTIGLSASSALRLYRSDGDSCEEKRFRRLFHAFLDRSRL